jgi:hypothetical protein
MFRKCAAYQATQRGVRDDGNAERRQSALILVEIDLLGLEA